jgi:anti-sigma B factor antagonist
VAAATPFSEYELEGVCVLSATGDLDLAAAVSFCAQIDAARRLGSRRLLLDLAGLRTCDTSGLRAVLGAAEEVFVSAGCAALVAPAAGAAARLFAFAGARETMRLHGSVAEGVAALASC